MNGWTGEPKATQEGSLIEANLPMGKSIGFLTSLRETNPSLLGELESILKSREGILIQRTLLLKGMERSGRGWDRQTRRRQLGDSCICFNLTHTSVGRQDSP